MSQAARDQVLQHAVELHRANRLAEAEALYRQVLVQDPSHPDALHMLGVMAYQTNQPQLAIALIGNALAQRPTWPEALSNLALAFKESGRIDEAIRAFEEALAIQPETPELLLNLGLVWKEQGNLAKAVECYRQALRRRPNYADAYNNLGNALGAMGNLTDATECYHQAVRMQPDYAGARLNLAVALLRAGNLQRGWEEYEWRRKIKGLPAAKRVFSQPLWSGEDLSGKTILLHAEQGFGDAIHFARYVSLVAERRPKQIFLECRGELFRLFQSLANVTLLAAGDPLPPFDVQAPLPSLPRAFGTTLNTIPNQVPYLSAPNDLIAHFANLLGQHVIVAPGTRVGLVWQGSLTHREDFKRSVPLASLAPLFEIPGLSFLSLQVGPAAAETAHSHFPIVDVSPHLKDFVHTAALITHLDLILTVDTAVAHLAGAIAKPTFLLLPRIPDWRWLLDRADSPWYPTLKLFRQTNPGDWAPVISALVTACREYSVVR